MSLNAKLIRITTISLALEILLKEKQCFMSQYFEVIGVSSPCKELAEVEKDEEVEVMAIDMSRHANKDIISLWNTYKFLKEKNRKSFIPIITNVILNQINNKTRKC